MVNTWANIVAGVKQSSILGPLLFFICINNLLDDLVLSGKLLADDTSLFSVIKTANSSSKDLMKLKSVMGHSNGK